LVRIGWQLTWNWRIWLLPSNRMWKVFIFSWWCPCCFMELKPGHLASDIGTLEAFHMKCQWQMINIHWFDHISNSRCSRDQACQQSYVTVACTYSGTLHAWTRESQQILPYTWQWISTKTGSHWQAGFDLQAVLVTPSSWLNVVLEDVNAIPWSTLWRAEIARGHGAMKPSIRTEMMMMMMMMTISVPVTVSMNVRGLGGHCGQYIGVLNRGKVKNHWSV